MDVHEAPSSKQNWAAFSAMTQPLAKANRACYYRFSIIEYTANSEGILCLVFGARRNLIIKRTKLITPKALSFFRKIGNRKSEYFCQGVDWHV